MTGYIALLRGVNVGGHRAVAMSDLRDLLTELCLTGARFLPSPYCRARKQNDYALVRMLPVGADVA